jgi:hypothetical protein
MPSDVGLFHGHRALIEHRDGASVLDALTGAGERRAARSSGLSVRWLSLAFFMRSLRRGLWSSLALTSLKGMCSGRRGCLGAVD